MSIGYVKKNFVKIKETDKEIPATKAFTEEASMEEIFEAVDRIFSERRLSTGCYETQFMQLLR